ncbi:hypothetical protein F4692_002923 [Nocardioides cavernae]|uniref:Uncharacterized protein n=1 Tax=Nocardioides cavernae TaxID=1921566 RepID=A0A7Y9H4I8_9ACTN|nr:hypothetical protein [Nocardioides cavernae]NYE37790.1 hypothetical protein [Nocardioides cavernae]
MWSRLGAPVLLAALAVPLGTVPSGAAPPDAAAGAGHAARQAATCSADALARPKPLRTRTGEVLGTARMYAATRGGDLGFCVRVKPVERLRTASTVVMVRKTTYDADGTRTSGGVIGGSGMWRTPIFVTGSIIGPGSSLRAVVGIQLEQGAPKGTATLRGTLD